MTSSIRIMPVLFAAGILLFCAAFFLRPSSSHSSAAGEHRPVIVELFTSEGCSSCPPADALLGHLRQDLAAQQIEVVPLGFRVDYWNSLGWNDRFSSAEFTRRQEDYIKTMKLDGPYTPQMVVNGEAEFVGNDASQAHSSITHAANQPQTAEIKISPAADNKLLVQVKTHGATDGSAVMLAITEDNLSTKIGAGENNGRTLHHASVVRTLKEIGKLHGGSFETAVPLNLEKDWKRNDLRTVVFVQDGPGGRIEGAASVALPDQLR
jgi:hypothetical protein